MQACWRWFGPRDMIPLAAIRQTGATGIVNALHERPAGAVWSREDIAARKALIATGGDGGASGLDWRVVESLPVSEDIKRQSGDWRAHVAAYLQSLENLAAEGIATICYNFMPVLDWTRTDLAWTLPDGSRCMRFDALDFAAFDLFILARPGAADDYDAETVAGARQRFSAMDETARERLARNVVFGLPGAAANMSLADVRAHLDLYAGISAERLFANLADFLQLVVPRAEELGLRLCCHPDDPPFALLGLPRVMSTEADLARLCAAVDLPANGITLCTGSLGTRSDNDPAGMMRRLDGRVHFLHLRNTRRDAPGIFGSFHESGHLEGDTDMVAVISAVLAEEARRRAEGRADADIPFRPDHGLDMTDDAGRLGQQPGYPLVGRHVGLAELRGAIAALSVQVRP